MININANLIKEPTFGSFMKDDKEVQVANFSLAKGYGKGKEYINCARQRSVRSRLRGLSRRTRATRCTQTTRGITIQRRDRSRVRVRC